MTLILNNNLLIINPYDYHAEDFLLCTHEYPEFDETGKLWLNYALKKKLSVPFSTQTW